MAECPQCNGIGLDCETCGLPLVPQAKLVAAETARDENYAQGLVVLKAMHDLQAQVDALRKERDQLRDANHSAAVCANHATDFMGDGCLVCDLIKAEAALTQATEYAESRVRAHDKMEQQLEHRTLTLGAAVKRAEDIQRKIDALLPYANHLADCAVCINRMCDCGFAEAYVAVRSVDRAVVVDSQTGCASGAHKWRWGNAVEGGRCLCGEVVWSEPR